MGMRGLQRASGLKSKGAVRVCEVEPSMRSLLAALLLLRPSACNRLSRRQSERDSDESDVFSKMCTRQGGNAVIKSPESPRTPTREV